ncbi:MAG: permease-like cell division protein FtsX [Bacteroidales bacterium]|nr:permease-like cell division protein FtsX [Bacteroidales bacterium]
MAADDSRRRLPRGAQGVRSRFASRFAGYMHHHRESLLSSLGRLLATPLQSLMTMLVLAIGLALPASLFTAMDNLRQLGGEVELSARMTVFVDRATPEAELEALVADLAALDDVADLVLVSREQALADFRESSGFGDVLNLLDENPLPAVVMVEPTTVAGGDHGRVSALASTIGADPRVDDVVVDLAWLQRFQALLDIGRRLVWALGVALGIGVLLIVGNTIRLAIASRREEIVVVKLIGGTNRFVRRPFLYSGLWYGVGAGLLAWLLVTLAVSLLASTIGQLAALYQSGFRLVGPGLGSLSTLLACGGLLGLAGAWIAVSVHLRHVEPE